MATEPIVYAVGRRSVSNRSGLYRSFDDGVTWEAMLASVLPSGLNTWLTGVWSHGTRWCAVGRGGEIIISDDGRDWRRPQSTPSGNWSTTGGYSSVWAWNENIWIAVGGHLVDGWYRPFVARSDDGGENWVRINTPIDGLIGILQDARGRPGSAARIVAVRSGDSSGAAVIASSDQGASWYQLDNDNTPENQGHATLRVDGWHSPLDGGYFQMGWASSDSAGAVRELYPQLDPPTVGTPRYTDTANMRAAEYDGAGRTIIGGGPGGGTAHSIVWHSFTDVMSFARYDVATFIGYITGVSVGEDYWYFCTERGHVYRMSKADAATLESTGSFGYGSLPVTNSQQITSGNTIALEDIRVGEVLAPPPEPTAPPTGLTVTELGEDQFQVSWNAVVEEHWEYEIRYVVERQRQDGGGWGNATQVYIGADTSFVDTVDPDTYRYRVATFWEKP